MLLTLNSNDSFSSNPFPNKLMHNGRICSGICEYSTFKARGVLAVTNIRFPMARK